jgi:hypothetical protein
LAAVGIAIRETATAREVSPATRRFFLVTVFLSSTAEIESVFHPMGATSVTIFTSVTVKQ